MALIPGLARGREAGCRCCAAPGGRHGGAAPSRRPGTHRRRRLRRLRRRRAPRGRGRATAEALRRAAAPRAASSGSACTSRPRREFAGIAGDFGLHPLAVEDAVHAHQRPKLERYDDTLFARLQDRRLRRARRAHRRPARSSRPARSWSSSAADFVVTVRHGGHGALRGAAPPPGGRPRAARASGPLAVLHAIADQVVDDYLAVADAVQDDIDEIESRRLLAPQRDPRHRADLPAQARGARAQAGGRAAGACRMQRAASSGRCC